MQGFNALYKLKHVVTKLSHEPEYKKQECAMLNTQTFGLRMLHICSLTGWLCTD